MDGHNKGYTPSEEEVRDAHWVLEQFERHGLVTSDPPIVGVDAHAANPHYEPNEGADALLEPDQVVLIDLWGGRSLSTVFADQTWMGFAGTAVPDEVQKELAHSAVD